jgi:PDZ domain
VTIQFNTILRFRLRIGAGLRIAAGASLTLFGVAIHTAQAKDPGLLTLTPDHFKQTAALTSDPVSGTTTISTEPGFVEHTGLMRTVWHDEYLQAVIDGKTGRRTYQIIAFEIYTGNPRSYETATFPTANGPRTVKTTALQNKAEFCATGACTYTERIAFPIEEETLRQAAGNAAASSPRLWRFELVAKAGPNYTGSLSTAEIAGLLTKVDDAANTVPAPKANAKATVQQDLGIEGIPVAATQEPPGRGGILIAGVKSGSIAQKAGVIIGDILYEFDGHPVMNPTDLQSAVAAATANAKIPLRIYRGLGTMTVTAQF